jgi:hypothetical protein
MDNKVNTRSKGKQTVRPRIIQLGEKISESCFSHPYFAGGLEVNHFSCEIFLRSPVCPLKALAINDWSKSN